MPARWFRFPITPVALVALLVPWTAAAEISPGEVRPADREPVTDVL